MLKCSRGDARRLITQGAVSVNGERVAVKDSADYQLKSGDIVKSGKRNYAKVI